MSQRASFVDEDERFPEKEASSSTPTKAPVEYSDVPASPDSLPDRKAEIPPKLASQSSVPTFYAAREIEEEEERARELKIYSKQHKIEETGTKVFCLRSSAFVCPVLLFFAALHCLGPLLSSKRRRHCGRGSVREAKDDQSREIPSFIRVGKRNKRNCCSLFEEKEKQAIFKSHFRHGPQKVYQVTFIILSCNCFH